MCCWYVVQCDGSNGVIDVPPVLLACLSSPRLVSMQHSTYRDRTNRSARGARPPATPVIVALVLVAINAAGLAAREPRTRIRARPPQADRWDRASRSAFLDDA